MAAAPRAAPTGTPTDEAEVPHDIGSGYVIERKLGIGSYATVWLARTTASETAQSTVVAVKAIERSRLTKKLQENLESEIAILRDFSHPHLVGFVELRKRPAKIFLVLEYLAGGDLQKFIKARKRLKEPVARRFLGHLASGLKFLWSKNLIHRDLKPQNLLLTDFSDDGFLKIADFGFARHLETAALAETLCGSPLYMAPEILSFKRYDAKADLWSVGAVLFEMLAGEPPFSGRDHRELLKNIKRKALRLPRDVAVSGECLKVLQILLKRDPIARCAFEEFFANAFVSGTGELSPAVFEPPMATVREDHEHDDLLPAPPLLGASPPLAASPLAASPLAASPLAASPPAAASLLSASPPFGGSPLAASPPASTPLRRSATPSAPQTAPARRPRAQSDAGAPAAESASRSLPKSEPRHRSRAATMPLSRSLTRDRQPWKPPVAPPPPRLADLAQSGSDEFVVVDDFYATPGAPADPTARPLDDEGLRAAETLAHGAMVLVKVADDLSRDVDEELDATRVAERPGPRALAIYVDCLKHLTKASHLVGDSGRPREGDRERSGRRSPGGLRDLDVLDRDATAATLRDYIDDAYAVILDRAKHCEAHVETLEGLADETPFLSGADAAAERAVRVARRAGKGCEIPNFKGSSLGRFPLVSADFWTSDHLSERSRRVDAFPGTRARAEHSR